MQTRLDLLPDGPEAKAALLALIGSARIDLRLIYYIFDADASGVEVRDALAAAAGRGVAVRLIVDGFGSNATPPDFFQPLVDAGAHVCRFVPRLGRHYFLRNHQKLCVADGTRAIIGGFNVADVYFEPKHETAFRDLGLRLEGPCVAQVARYFDALHGWVNRPRARLFSLRRLLARMTQREGRLRWVFSGPFRRASPYAVQLRADLQRATRVDVMMAYFAPSRRLLRLLAAAAYRGRVRLITAAKTDVKLTRWAAWHTFRRLLRAGVRLMEYEPRALHAKLIIVDDTVWIGSGNLDIRSLYINLEIMLRVEDPALARQARRLFEGEIANCEPIDGPRYKAAATWYNRLLWQAAYGFYAGVDLALARRLTG